MKLHDLAERLVWTFVATFLSAVTAAGLGIVDVSVLEAAVLAGLGDVATVLTVVARARLRVLPDPGDGLPGLPASPARSR